MSPVRRHVVGRTDELETIHQYFQSDASAPRALVIEGEAGIGKTTLWMAGLDHARGRGMRVLTSRPTKADQTLAFAGLGDLLDTVVGELLPSLTTARRNALEAALLLGDVGDRVEPRALGVAVRDVLTLLAADGPLLIAVDDVQWLDGSSASALGFAVRRLEAPLAVLLTRRVEPGTDRSELEGAIATNPVGHVRVGPLSLEATQAVIRTDLDRAIARPTLVRIHATAGGNPFYALELARALGDHVDPTVPLPVPASLDELMAARLAGLPDETRLGLGLVAAAGEPSWMLLRAAGVEPALLEPAFAANVLESTASAVRFSHPLLASTYYGRLTPVRRREMHRLLAGLRTEPVERARHLALATDTPDGQIAATLEAAAELATARGAIPAAAALRQHALRLTPPDADDDVHRRTVALARALHSVADVSRATALARGLLDRTPAGPRRAETLVLLYDIASDDRDGPGLIREALEHAADDPVLQVRILQVLGWDLRFDEGTAAAEPYAEAALAVAEGLADDELLASSLAVAAASRLHLGKPGATELAERAYALVSTIDNLAVRADVAGYLLTTSIATRDFDRQRSLLEPLCDELTEHAEWLAAGAFWALALVECFTGRLHLAADLAARAHQFGAIYNPGQDQVADLYLDALIAVHRGILGEAGLAATEALDLAREQLPS
jgi:hypothetical protein